MKKILCFALLSLLAITSIHAQKNKQKKDQVVEAPAPKVENFKPQVEGPEISFEKNVHDYGQLDQGANGACEFRFQNIGSEPLILTNVQTSCGCTAPSWSREPIMPGQWGSITITYDTNRIGYIGKSITVYSNGKSDRLVLRISGNVNPKQN